LDSVPAGCALALDVGCGEGLLARELAGLCEEVIAIDADGETLARARARGGAESRVRFIQGDVMNYALPDIPDAGFDLITAVASLHHLPLQPALLRFRELLTPGGVLAVIGLYRLHGIEDYAWAAAAFPVSRVLRLLRRRSGQRFPIREPKETLREIRAACDAILPGGLFRRHLLFRYSFVWRKP
jgi:SAM-dependent methyltransferase